MPAAYKRCVSHVKAKGHSEQSSHAICTSRNAGNIKQVRKSEARAHKSGKSGKSGGHGGK